MHVLVIINIFLPPQLSTLYCYYMVENGIIVNDIGPRPTSNTYRVGEKNVQFLKVCNSCVYDGIIIERRSIS